MDNLIEGTIWEAKARPGRMVKVVEILPNTVYFENLHNGATFPRPKVLCLNRCACYHNPIFFSSCFGDGLRTSCEDIC